MMMSGEVEAEVDIVIDEDEDIKNGMIKETDNCERRSPQITSPASPPFHGYHDMDQEEIRHYHKIASTFKKYKNFSFERIEKTVNFINTMPKRHQVLLKDYKEHVLIHIQKCIDVNHNLFQLMILDSASMFENHEEVYPRAMQAPYPEPTRFDFDKLQAVLKHIVRDWSADGQKERDTCYTPLIAEVEEQYGSTRINGYSDIKILVPGAGMGRLSHELVKKGYIVQGNEFSLFMIFASNFILNKCTGKNIYKCHPWIHQNTNILNHHDQIREVAFPDVDPCDLPPNTNCRFSMTAGDFLDAYSTPSQESSWDCIVTCFFIDCANNIIAYLERIFYCLKEGGLWINLGPLLYHYSDLPEENSIEPPFDFLLEIIKNVGFQVKKIDTNVPTMYAENEKSMLSYSYRSVFLVCCKPVHIDTVVSKK